MDTPLITWVCITALFAIAIIVRFVHAACHCARGRHRIIEFGTEREELFIPGDPDPKNIDGYDYEDFEDL